MKKTIAFLALALAAPLVLAACGPKKLETGLAPSASYSPLPPEAQIFYDASAVVAHFVGTAGRSSPSELQTGDYPGDAGDQLLVFTVSRLADDAVAAMEWRVLIKRDGDGVRVVNAGVRQRCTGSTSREWTTAQCL